MYFIPHMKSLMPETKSIRSRNDVPFRPLELNSWTDPNLICQTDTDSKVDPWRD